MLLLRWAHTVGALAHHVPHDHVYAWYVNVAFEYCHLVQLKQASRALFPTRSVDPKPFD